MFISSKGKEGVGRGRLGLAELDKVTMTHRNNITKELLLNFTKKILDNIGITIQTEYGTNLPIVQADFHLVISQSLFAYGVENKQMGEEVEKLCKLKIIDYLYGDIYKEFHELQYEIFQLLNHLISTGDIERIRELLEKFHSRIDFHNTENDKK